MDESSRPATWRFGRMCSSREMVGVEADIANTGADFRVVGPLSLCCGRDRSAGAAGAAEPGVGLEAGEQARATTRTSARSRDGQASGIVPIRGEEDRALLVVAEAEAVAEALAEAVPEEETATEAGAVAGTEAAAEEPFVSKGSGDATGIRPGGGASDDRAEPRWPPSNGANLGGNCGGGGRSSGSALEETGTGAWKVPIHRPAESQSMAPALRAEGDPGLGEPSALGLRLWSGDQVGAGEIVGPMLMWFLALPPSRNFHMPFR
mmetsp:Transcript_125226/g.267307  ORF Transcript_125226/g.267307 Transcript_125226/m.267307 type:complete len:264 (+) Transcript_125226:341-1132(+)